MSLTVEVSVHCDGCGHWRYCAEISAEARRKAGWTTENARASWRRDYCPACSRRRAETTEVADGRVE